MFRYTAYGLHIQSALALPEFIVDDQTEPDVYIQYGSLGWAIPTEAGFITYLRAAPQEVCLSWGSTANLLIRNGRDITIDALPGVDERVLRLFILGSGLGVLLHQRQQLVLHASAVVIDDQVVAFAGESGWGKSTTAAALHARGHRMMTDDLVVVEMRDDRPVVIPGYPQLKLWPEAVEALGADPAALPQLRINIEKRAQATRDRFSAASLPLGAVYILAKGDGLRIEALPPQMRLMALVRNLYVSGFGTQFAQATQDDTSFLQCADVAKRVPVRLLRRQYDLASIARLADLIEDDFRQLQPVSTHYEA